MQWIAVLLKVVEVVILSATGCKVSLSIIKHNYREHMINIAMKTHHDII